MARSRRSPAAYRPAPRTVRAVYAQPGGEHNIYVMNAPSGQVYFVAWQKPFEIAVEDVNWFFTKWAHREWLQQVP